MLKLPLEHVRILAYLSDGCINIPINKNCIKMFIHNSKIVCQRAAQRFGVLESIKFYISGAQAQPRNCASTLANLICLARMCSFVVVSSSTTFAFVNTLADVTAQKFLSSIASVFTRYYNRRLPYASKRGLEKAKSYEFQSG